MSHTFDTPHPDSSQILMNSTAACLGRIKELAQVSALSVGVRLNDYSKSLIHMQ